MIGRADRNDQIVEEALGARGNDALVPLERPPILRLAADGGN